ncbi:MAG: hypothetical protein ABIH82_04120 [Candidatus Woesearchaeota archaeon]
MNLDIANLEMRLSCTPQLDQLEQLYDTYYDPTDRKTEAFLRSVKIFLKKEKERRYEIFKRSKLMGSDCLTMAVLSADLAHRKGYDVQIIRPEGFSKFCHAAVSYDGGKVYKITGTTPIEAYSTMNNNEIIWRLRFTKPIVDFVNHHIRHVY